MVLDRGRGYVRSIAEDVVEAVLAPVMVDEHLAAPAAQGHELQSVWYGLARTERPPAGRTNPVRRGADFRIPSRENESEYPKIARLAGKQVTNPVQGEQARHTLAVVPTIRAGRGGKGGFKPLRLGHQRKAIGNRQGRSRVVVIVNDRAELCS